MAEYICPLWGVGWKTLLALLLLLLPPGRCTAYRLFRDSFFNVYRLVSFPTSRCNPSFETYFYDTFQCFEKGWVGLTISKTKTEIMTDFGVFYKISIGLYKLSLSKKFFHIFLQQNVLIIKIDFLHLFIVNHFIYIYMCLR